jgi:hypothetical protein
MATFCGNCGTSNDTGSFCYNCGHPLAVSQQQPEEPDPTLQMPPAPASPPPPSSYPTPSSSQPAYPPPPYPPAPGYGQRPAMPRVNPFLGWPVSDYVRDAAAAFCLFACLGMWWDISDDPKGGDHWWVVISVLLSVASLALPYVCKAQVVPGWTPLHFRLAKLAANVPFLASVLAAVVNELVNLGEDFEAGLGAGIGMGLAGAMLAIQPRAADDPMHREDRFWNRAAAGVAIAAVAVGILMFVGFVIDTDDLFDEVAGFFAFLLVSLGMLLVLAGWPLAGFLGGSAAWRRVFSTSTFTLIGTALFAHADDGAALFFWPLVEKWYGGATGFGGIGIGGTFLIGAAAGLSVARSLSRRPGEQTEPVAEWAKTASSALLVTAAGALVSAVALVLGIVTDSGDPAAPIVVTVLVLAIAGAAGYASILLRDPRKHRLLALGLITGIVVVGLVVMGVVNGQDMNIEALGTGPSIPVTGWVVAAWVTLPLLAAYALTVPGQVRTALGPLVPQQAAYPQGYPQQPSYPAPPGPPPSQPPAPPAQ